MNIAAQVFAVLVVFLFGSCMIAAIGHLINFIIKTSTTSIWPREAPKKFRAMFFRPHVLVVNKLGDVRNERNGVDYNVFKAYVKYGKQTWTVIAACGNGLRPHHAYFVDTKQKITDEKLIHALQKAIGKYIDRAHYARLDAEQMAKFENFFDMAKVSVGDLPS